MPAIPLTLLAMTCLTGGKLTHLEYSPVEFETWNHIKNSSTRTDFETCNIIVTAQDDLCYRELYMYTKHDRCARKIVSSLEDTRFLTDTRTTTTILLMGHLEDLGTVTDVLINTTFFRNSGKFRFVVCTAPEDDPKVNESLRKIWSYGVMKASLVYFYESLRVASYDPFAREFRNWRALDMDDNAVEFLSNARNMQRSPISVTMFRADEGYLRSSFDKVMIDALSSVVNATIKVLLLKRNDTFSKVVSTVASGGADLYPFTVSTASFARYQNGVDFTFPHMVNHIVALVPKPATVSNGIGLVGFSNKAFLLLVPALIVLALLDKHLNDPGRRGYSFSPFLFSVFGMRIIPFENRSTLVLSWMIFNLIVAIMLNVQVLEDFITPRTDGKITTLAELESRHMNIYSICVYDNISVTHTNIDSPGIFVDLLIKNGNNNSYILPYNMAMTIIRYHSYIGKWLGLEIMSDPVVPSMGAYMVKRNSPYIGVLNRAIMSLRELGEKPLSFPPETKKIVSSVVTFENFWPTFMGLLKMYAVCAAVFVIELAVHCVKRRSKLLKTPNLKVSVN